MVFVSKIEEYRPWLEKAVVCYTNKKMHLQEFKSMLAAHEDEEDVQVFAFNEIFFLVSMKREGMNVDLDEECKQRINTICNKMVPWSKELKSHRKFILEISGMHVHVWNQANFTAICKPWGEVLEVYSNDCKR